MSKERSVGDQPWARGSGGSEAADSPAGAPGPLRPRQACRATFFVGSWGAPPSSSGSYSDNILNCTPRTWQVGSVVAQDKRLQLFMRFF